MGIYSAAVTGTTTTSGNCAADCVAVGSGVAPQVMEWGTFLGAATASTFSLRRTTAVGTRTTPTTLLAEDQRDPALTGITDISITAAFSAEPTEATAKMRSIGLPATIGVGIIWTFPKGLVLPAAAASGQIALVHDATNAASHHHHVVCDV